MRLTARQQSAEPWFSGPPRGSLCAQHHRGGSGDARGTRKRAPRRPGGCRSAQRSLKTAPPNAHPRV